MLKNVSNSGGINRYRFEGHTESVFSIAAADVDVSGLGGGMLELIEKSPNLLKCCKATDTIAADAVALVQAAVVGVNQCAHCHTPRFPG